MFFFFKQKTAYEMRISDWSSDVCSSDLSGPRGLNFGVDRCRFPAFDDSERLPASDGLAEVARARDDTRADRGGHDLHTLGVAFDRCGEGQRTPTTADHADQLDTGFRSAEPTSELQPLIRIPYAVFCLQNKTT